MKNVQSSFCCGSCLRCYRAREQRFDFFSFHSDLFVKVLTVIFYLSIFSLQMQCQHRNSATVDRMEHLLAAVVCKIKHQTCLDRATGEYILSFCQSNINFMHKICNPEENIRQIIQMIRHQLHHP